MRNTQISRRLDRLYCHDSSPYVYRGPFRVIEDKIEVKKWILGVQIVVLDRQSNAIRKELEDTKGRLEELNRTSDT